MSQNPLIPTSSFKMKTALLGILCLLLSPLSMAATDKAYYLTDRTMAMPFGVFNNGTDTFIVNMPGLKVEGATTSGDMMIIIGVPTIIKGSLVGRQFTLVHGTPKPDRDVSPANLAAELDKLTAELAALDVEAAQQIRSSTQPTRQESRVSGTMPVLLTANAGTQSSAPAALARSIEQAPQQPSTVAPVRVDTTQDAKRYASTESPAAMLAREMGSLPVNPAAIAMVTATTLAVQPPVRPTTAAALVTNAPAAAATDLESTAPTKGLLNLMERAEIATLAAQLPKKVINQPVEMLPTPIPESAIPSMVPVWKAAKTLKTTLLDWAKQEKWTVKWLPVELDYEIEGDLAFAGTFQSAIGQLFDLYKKASRPMLLKGSERQKLIVISEVPLTVSGQQPVASSGNVMFTEAPIVTLTPMTVPGDVASSQKWEIVAGQDLKNALSLWGKVAGWSINWDPAVKGANFPESISWTTSFVRAAQQAFQMLPDDFPAHVSINTTNKTLTVAAAGKAASGFSIGTSAERGNEKASTK